MRIPSTPQPRVVFDQPVPKQHPHYFEVKSKGVTVEYTSKYLEALDAFNESSTPRQMFKIEHGFKRAIK